MKEKRYSTIFTVKATIKALEELKHEKRLRSNGEAIDFLMNYYYKNTVAKK